MFFARFFISLAWFALGWKLLHPYSPDGTENVLVAITKEKQVVKFSDCTGRFEDFPVSEIVWTRFGDTQICKLNENVTIMFNGPQILYYNKEKQQKRLSLSSQEDDHVLRFRVYSYSGTHQFAAYLDLSHDFFVLGGNNQSYLGSFESKEGPPPNSSIFSKNLSQDPMCRIYKIMYGENNTVALSLGELELSPPIYLPSPPTGQNHVVVSTICISSVK